ncbi:error-prone DNA polymerase [Bdellovibrio sp. SKB1291214]|uniref:DNA polymerase III subunit alpha n=1 Tax=Bdellovibrio sp. SKB1291214 TaxID=1732569 RepID=UPI00223F718C|nr:error-prone DNA polymerase [Bdellovibrio sp. SKB1291214]UYL10222.1 error-prone DNA polymerase [Bdellovibrio sp. SKB1291214]
MSKSVQVRQTHAITPTAKGFVELLGRSNFSFLRGASSPEEMVEAAIHNSYDGIAMCDLNGLYGVARGFLTANTPSMFTESTKPKDGFRYIIGSELTLTDQSTITLIPMNKNGYTHLCELLTLGKRQAAKGFSSLRLEQIEKYNQDLLCLALPPIDEKRYDSLEKIFKDRLYIPVWRDLTWESHEFYRQALLLEQKCGAQLFVSQRPFMHTRKRKPLFDVLTCVLHHTTLEQAKDKLIQNAERSLRTIPEISSLWADRVDLVEKTVEIAARVNFTLNEIRYRYPRSNLPQGKTPTEYLRFLVEEGIKWRFPEGASEQILKTIDHELKMIKELEYEDYFLTLREICEFADRKGILYQGRGSAANSIVCFCIGLTSVNPKDIDVLFERFISVERREPPDIDIDFEHSRREEVIQYIYEKYNERHAAMVCTVVRYRSRMAIREAAKAFGISLEHINAMVKFMGRDGMRRLIEDPNIHKRFGVENPQVWMLFLEMARQLHGFPRHLGIHTGGFLITQDPITEMVPVEKATMNGRYVIQWNKDDVATLKLMKIDVLSLGMLTCLRKCFDLLKNHKGLSYNLATLPQNDPKTYDMICKAETVGVFQIESRAQMQTLPRMLPRNFYDLVVEVALVRPGPLQGGMVHPYLRRRQGLEPVDYAHKDLIPILKRTHGVPIFQEQVMRIVIVAAGFSPGEADELRRIMSSAWRKRSTMDAIRDRIMTGFKNHGISEQYAEQIYATIEGFANYGFPESHAASFAVLTYASCYLKCRHPDVFACGLLNSQPMGFYAPRTIIAEAQRNGVKVAPLCIQKSDYDYILEEENDNRTHTLRVGFRSIYGLPEEQARKIEDERKLNGCYKDIKDFIQRTQLPRGTLVKLAATGAMECFETSARELIWHIEGLSLDQNSFLWGQPKEVLTHTPVAEHDEDDSDHLPFESNWDRMRREYETKGFSVDSHPLSVLRSYLNTKNQTLIEQRFIPYVTSTDLERIINKRKVRVAGMISITQRPPTAKGMCFITLEDEFGFMNIVIHPDVYQKNREVIYSGRSLLEVQGQVEKVGSIINVRAINILPLG